MFHIELEKIVAYNKSAIFPICILGMFLVYFFSTAEYSEENYQTIHASFMGSIFITMLIMGIARVVNVTIMSFVMYLSYYIINNLRYTYGEDYIFSAGYNIWSALILPNILLAYFIFGKKGMSKYWSIFLIFLLLQTLVIEHFQKQSIDADSYYFYKHIGMFNYPALIIALLSILIMFIHYIRKGRILGAGTLFSVVSIFLGIYYSDNIYAYSLFFLSSSLIMLTSSVYYLYYTKNKDEELGIANSKTYMREAESKYPLKYSISLLYIDEYDRLNKRFGSRKMLLLKKMFLERIRNIDSSVEIYNYKSDAIILVFMNMTAPECFEKAENIRRIIAKSIFVFNENNNLQLTISQCVSEKKRSDANALVVLNRAEENLQKACKFTHNITIKS